MLGIFKSFMYSLNFKAILTIGLFFLVSNFAIGASDIKKVKRLVARLQMEVMQLKEKSSNIADAACLL